MRWFCFFLLTTAYCLEMEVSARSAILMNADTGAVLYEKHAHTPMYPASITKIATALFVLDQKKPKLSQLTTVSAEALKIKPARSNGDFPAYWGDVAGTKMGLMKGEALSFEALLHGLMRISGNDAANVIAESLSSSIPDFISEMNQYLRSLGCTNTQFQNPHGLHHNDHFTTAYDMCLITKVALQIPKFREIVSSAKYIKPETNKQAAGEIRQSNGLLKAGKHYYPKAIGVKTGCGSHAMSTLVAAAEHEGRTLIAVLLGCKNRADRYEDAIALFERAFAEKQETRVFFTPAHRFTKEMEGAKSPLQATLQGDLAISYFPSEKPVCRAFVHWEEGTLPIAKGQKVGEVRIEDSKGAVLQVGNLIAQEEVIQTFMSLLKGFFGI